MIFKTYIKYILLITLLASCKNSSKEINDFLADQNLPVGVAENINHMYKDSGKITSRLIAPILWDFSNREINPYSEFPEGIKIVNINRKTRDSVTITGDYAISYSQTLFSEIIGNVKIVNHQQEVILCAHQMYWDQAQNYFFSESSFTIFTAKDTIQGIGFESESNLNNWILNKTHGNFTPENEN